LKLTYFHGDIDRAEAKAKMKGTPEGTFLIRFSGQPGLYVFSSIKGNEFKEGRIVYEPDRGFSFAQHSGTHYYPTLHSFVSKQHAKLGMKVVCGGSKYEELFATPLEAIPVSNTPVKKDNSDGKAANNQTKENSNGKDKDSADKENGEEDNFNIDAVNESTSNWLRWVNSARWKEEQNMIALLFNYTVYYMTIVDVEPERELLIWYGTNYAKKVLHIYTKKGSGHNWDVDVAPPKDIVICASCPATDGPIDEDPPKNTENTPAEEPSQVPEKQPENLEEKSESATNTEVPNPQQRVF